MKIEEIIDPKSGGLIGARISGFMGGKETEIVGGNSIAILMAYHALKTEKEKQALLTGVAMTMIHCAWVSA